MIVNCFSERQIFVTIWYSMINNFLKCVSIRKCTYQYLGLLYPTRDSELNIDAPDTDSVLDGAQVLARVLHLGVDDDQGSSHLPHVAAEFHCCLVFIFGHLEPPGKKGKYWNICQSLFQAFISFFFLFYFIQRQRIYLMEKCGQRMLQ